MAEAIWAAAWQVHWQQTLGRRSQGTRPGVVELSKDVALVAEAGHQLLRLRERGEGGDAPAAYPLAADTLGGYMQHQQKKTGKANRYLKAFLQRIAKLCLKWSMTAMMC